MATLHESRGLSTHFNPATPHSTMIVTGHISNIICITELLNKPRVACTQLKYWVVYSRFIPNFFKIYLSEAKEFIGRFYHIFRGYANKNLHFPPINIAQIHL